MASEYQNSDEAKSFDPQELTRIACQQLEQSILYKRPRLEDIKKNEDLYLGKVQKPLKGRFNVPVPVMSGFVDTLLSKVDERIRIQYRHQEIADYRAAKKVTAAWEIDSSPNRGRWAQKDRVAKKLAILSGVAVFEQYAESEPYKSCLEVTDYNDFHCEPLGGQDLEKHLFLGVDNVFRTQAELDAGAESGLYDKAQVNKLKLFSDTPEVDKQNNDSYLDKQNRFIALGLSPTSNSYVGQKVFNLVKWGMVYNGVRYYLLFDYKSKIWLRCDELKEVYPVKKGEEEVWPWTSWHTHEDSLVFWNKAPADDVRPIAESIRVLINQELENRNKRNFGMRGYDPDKIKDPSKLRWEPEGLVAIQGGGSDIRNFVYEFNVGELTGTINLVQWLDQFLGRKTGVTNDVQGSSTEDKVGIYQGNLQQVAERIGLMSKSYQDCYTDLGLRYVRLLREHLSTGFAVKMIGESGIEWAEITEDDVNPLRDFDIVITGGSAEDQLAVLEKNRKVESVKLVLLDPELRQMVNKKWAVKEFLVNGGGYSEEELKIGMDTNNETDLEAVSRAAQENQDLIAGADVEPDRLANTAHVQHHINFAFSQKLNPKMQTRLMAIIEAELPIAAENMARKAFLQNPQAIQPEQQVSQPQLPTA